MMPVWLLNTQNWHVLHSSCFLTFFQIFFKHLDFTCVCRNFASKNSNRNSYLLFKVFRKYFLKKKKKMYDWLWHLCIKNVGILNTLWLFDFNIDPTCNDDPCCVHVCTWVGVGHCAEKMWPSIKGMFRTAGFHLGPGIDAATGRNRRH